MPNNYSNEELRIALDASVRLQAHYAGLLNMHDGGKRKVFKSTGAWIRRLRVTGDIVKRSMKRGRR